jgi:hypothetical protein
MNDQAHGRCGGDRENDEGQDEKCCLFARFVGGARDAEGADKGIGKEIEELHTEYYAPSASLDCRGESYRTVGLAADSGRGYTELGLNWSKVCFQGF